MSDASESATATEIEQRLRERLHPVILQLFDESAKHAGHRGATSGGGHYRLVVVSSAFDGKTSIDRHRLVHEILADMFGDRIHALTMRTLTPDQWEADGS